MTESRKQQRGRSSFNDSTSNLTLGTMWLTCKLGFQKSALLDGNRQASDGTLKVKMKRRKEIEDIVPDKEPQGWGTQEADSPWQQ
jgi:hypothetical protein